MVRARAGNPIVASFIGAAPRDPSMHAALALAALVTATAAMLVRTALVPGTIDGLIAVALIGAVAWRSAAAMVRVPSSAKRRPANDNPPRPCLPPHDLW